jgi:hypothetical protein
MLCQLTCGLEPDGDYQVAPWTAWDVANTGMEMKVETDICKSLKLQYDPLNQNLYTKEAAMFFYMWEEWEPWGHYDNVVPKLKEAHIRIMKKYFSPVCIFFTILIIHLILINF